MANSPTEFSLLCRDRDMAAYDNTCYTKAVKRGQRTFTLVEQDRTAQLTILRWIELNWEHAPEAKLQDAFEDALAMKRSVIEKKWPD